MRKHLLLLLSFLLLLPCMASAKKRTVYVSYVLHGNMNYDRYVRPVIWEEFPKIYDNLLTFMDEHRDFKGQLQFSGQTLGSLKQCAPDVVDHALRIHQRGQLNFTGTFYSEPVNVNMDGETNFRCAYLGTKIVEDEVGETDGFYLQERAYHAQLPWILNNANVSWTPVITGESDWYPFRLKGMDGSATVCVPITRHGQELLTRLPDAPKNALLLIEEDYEIPQSFVETYEDIQKFNASQDEVQVEWITVKDYIRKYGTKGERMVDHSAKMLDRDGGTYSRWSADPLDIIVQDFTNKAMADRRAAEILSALLQDRYGENVDADFSASGVSLIHDPLTWNIERADLYPDVEPRYLSRNGQVTLLSKAEHLLLWAVNSDAKGWYPLYEKRRERINSFENSSMLSREVINRALDAIASRMSLEGYEDYYIAANMEQARKSVVEIEADHKTDFFDAATGALIPCTFRFENGVYRHFLSLDLPSYGYMTLGLKTSKEKAGAALWSEGTQVSKDGITLSWDGQQLLMTTSMGTTALSLEPFQIKALHDMSDGGADDVWRQAVPYGGARVSVLKDASEIRIERQPDWLVHLQETYRIQDGKVECTYRFVFPHPTLVRQDGTGTQGKNSWDPRGLVLDVNTNRLSSVFYDMPFGISQCQGASLSYLCPLSSCFMEQEGGSGLLISPQTGEQAFSVEPQKGLTRIYMGASTTTGPVRKVGLKFNNPTNVDHEPAWYQEPFQGTYSHTVVLAPYQGGWQTAAVPALIRSISSPVYLRKASGAHGMAPLKDSFLELDQKNVDITIAQYAKDGLKIRLNERHGKETDLSVKSPKGVKSVHIQPFGIIMK